MTARPPDVGRRRLRGAIDDRLAERGQVGHADETGEARRDHGAAGGGRSRTMRARAASSSSSAPAAAAEAFWAAASPPAPAAPRWSRSASRISRAEETSRSCAGLKFGGRLDRQQAHLDGRRRASRHSRGACPSGRPGPSPRQSRRRHRRTLRGCRRRAVRRSRRPTCGACSARGPGVSPAPSVEAASDASSALHRLRTLVAEARVVLPGVGGEAFERRHVARRFALPGVARACATPDRRSRDRVLTFALDAAGQVPSAWPNTSPSARVRLRWSSTATMLSCSVRRSRRLSVIRATAAAESSASFSRGLRQERLRRRLDHRDEAEVERPLARSGADLGDRLLDVRGQLADIGGPVREDARRATRGAAA